MKLKLPTRDQIVTRLIKGAGYSAILFVVLIFYFLAREGLPAINPRIFGKLFGTRWGAVLGEVGRRRAGDASCYADAARDQIRLRDACKPHCKVDALRDEIDHPVIELQIERYLGVSRRKSR